MNFRTGSITLMAACALSAFIAGRPASAQVIYDVNNAQITAQPENDGDWVGAQDAGVIYDSSTTASAGGTTVTGSATNNPSIVEDYVSIAAEQLHNLTTFVFAGGVATVNHVLFFNFYSASSTFKSGFGVRLPQAGNFVWTITTNSLVQYVADRGFSQMVPDTGVNNPDSLPSVVTWRFTTSAPTIGTTTGTIYRQKMTVTDVPAPGALVTALIGGVPGVGFLLRRRRA